MKNIDRVNKLLNSLNDVDDKYVEEALEFYDKNKSGGCREILNFNPYRTK